MFRSPALVILSLSLNCALLGHAFAQPAGETYIRLRDEGIFRSQIMQTVHFLTDVYGPRLTGSPGLKAAADWAMERMQSWGMENCHLEPWDFGHAGWTNERFSGHILSPVKNQLSCRVLAWTPGTNGEVRGKVFMMVVPEKPTMEQLSHYLDSIREDVKGKIVFVGNPRTVPVTMNPPPRRRDDDEARRYYDPRRPALHPADAPHKPAEAADGSILTPEQINEKIRTFLRSAGALVRVADGGGEVGIIRTLGSPAREIDTDIPSVVMRNEDYGRISRILADGTPVELSFDIVNRSHPEGRTSYNTIGEIRGNDKKDEVVMLGAHLDSWHSATGATDNAIGCAVMMEAARILIATGIKPRRTVRIALWSGEEQGLLGSLAYVREHFGSFENPKPEYFKLGAYLNVDSGTGRPRGMSVFGPPQAAAILREILSPFEDLGIVGVIATTSRRLGGTDSTSFNHAGLPGINVGQDPIEYGAHTWHTNVDTYERILEEDAKGLAICIAAAVYQLSMRDGLLPRLSQPEMPSAPTS